MKHVNQWITLAFGLMLTFTTVTAYAWWNQTSTTVDHIDMMIGYGNRVSLRNLSPSNQGKLVPKGTPMGSIPGYTTQYDMTFSVEITGVYHHIELVLSILNLQIKTKSNIVIPYDSTDSNLTALGVTLSSPNASMTFLDQSSLMIDATDTIMNFKDEDLNLPTFIFNLRFELDDSRINRESFQILSEATIGFDITVEVLP